MFLKKKKRFIVFQSELKSTRTDFGTLTVLVCRIEEVWNPSGGPLLVPVPVEINRRSFLSGHPEYVQVFMSK